MPGISQTLRRLQLKGTPSENSTLLELLILEEYGNGWSDVVKKAMIAVLDGQSLTDDVLITTMCLVEQTLNARPLTSQRFGLGRG